MSDVRKYAETTAMLASLVDHWQMGEPDRNVARLLLKSYLREIAGSLPVTVFNEYSQ